MELQVKSVLVTGANRGIGFEIVKQLLGLQKPPQVIFATYRDEAKIKDLENLKKEAENKTEIVLIKADVTDPKDIKAAQKVVEDKVKDNGLNLLVNNAGVLQEKPFEELTEEHLLFHYKTNTVGPILFFKEMLPLLEKAAARKKNGLSVSRAAVINITSKYASIGQQVEDKDWLRSIGYRISKTAMNMAMRILSIIVKDKGILVVCIHPGWLKTDMGRKEAPEEVSEAIRTVVKLMGRLDDSHHGALIEKDGNPFTY